MLIARGLIAAICLAAIPFAIVHWLSQNLPPQPLQVQSQQKADRTINSQQYANTEQGDTRKSISSIAQAEPSYTEEKRHDKADDREQEGTEFWPTFLGLKLKVTDSLLVLVTLGLFGATVALWRSTDKLWKAGDDQFRLTKEMSDRQAVEIQNQFDIAREANRAAQKSADAATATERARFYIVIGSHNLQEFLKNAGRYPNSPTMPFSFEPKIEYAFRNYGKTPGIISEVSHGLIVQIGPPDAIYGVSKHLFTEHMIASGGTTKTQTFDGPTLFKEIRDALPILTGQAHFWFHGRLDYEDVFGNPQVHRFFTRYVKIGLEWGFQPYDHKHYNKST